VSGGGLIVEFRFETLSPEQTEEAGFLLAGLLPKGTLVALHGDLAAGKTCFVRGMARCFDQHAPVHSPTFTLVNQYGTDMPLYHLDLYRLSGPEELADLGYEEVFDSEGVCVVEWAERAEGWLPEQRIDLHLAHAGGDRRTLHFHNRGIALPANFEERLQALLGA
jgi:tRNA threonylcarbamoyladenosine biosynthesis protein TsaE